MDQSVWESSSFGGINMENRDRACSEETRLCRKISETEQGSESGIFLSIRDLE